MNRILTVAAVVAVASSPSSASPSPRSSRPASPGDTYLMTVAPLDPIDPFRGAYVDPRLPRPAPRRLRSFDGPGWARSRTARRATSTSPSSQQGDVWVAGEWPRERPDDGPYLACDDRTGRSGAASRASSSRRTRPPRPRTLLRDGAVAEVRIDGRGNAAVVDVRAP